MDEIQTAAEALKKISGVDLNIGLAVGITFCLNALGAYLKSSDWFPTNRIPFALIAAAAIAYPAFSENYKPSNWIIGFGVGFVAIGAHQSARAVKEIAPSQKKDSDQPPQP